MNTDEQILEIIKDNARLTYKEIGDRIGISRVAVKNHMDAMEKNGIIKGYHTMIGEKTDRQGTRFFLDVETEPCYFNQVLRYLSSRELIYEVYSVTGDCRIHAVGFAENQKELDHLINIIRNSGREIKKMSCHTVLSTVMDRRRGVEYAEYQKSQYLEGTDN